MSDQRSAEERLTPTDWAAWLIERRRGGSVQFASFEEGGCVWVDDPLAACHFARRKDAESMAFGEECDAVCEHQFGVPAATSILDEQEGGA